MTTQEKKKKGEGGGEDGRTLFFVLSLANSESTCALTSLVICSAVLLRSFGGSTRNGELSGEGVQRGLVLREEKRVEGRGRTKHVGHESDGELA